MRQWIIPAYLVAVLLVIYAPRVGQGFVADDYGWIAKARPPITSAIGAALNHTTDFYRPVVRISFALNFASSGLSPRSYGLLNLFLLVGCAILVGWLAAEFGLSWGFCVLAAALFAFNPHGIDMSVLWISGRTGLFLTLFALSAAIAFKKGHLKLCAFFTFLALLSKEEAVMLPIMFTLWAALDEIQARIEDGRGRSLRPIAWIWAALAVYTVLRFHSGAILPTNAPPGYRFTVAGHLLVRNIREYADRAGTFSVVAVIAVFCASRQKLHLSTVERATIVRSAVWLCFGFALTIFLPERSSLYAIFPSVGVVIAATTIISSMWPQVTARNRVVLVTVGLILPIALLPVYYARGDRWVSVAKLSNTVFLQLEEVAAQRDVRTIILRDHQMSRTNLANALGPAGSDIASLISDRPLDVRILPPPHVARTARFDEIELKLDPVSLRLVPAWP
jgi:hypothetical protein